MAQFLIVFKFIKNLKNKTLQLKNKNIVATNLTKKNKLKLISYGNYINTSKKLTKDLDKKKM